MLQRTPDVRVKIGSSREGATWRGSDWCSASAARVAHDPPGALGIAQAPVREISQIAGEVYRFRNQNHYSVFAVTPAGIIATDPINAEAAQWLKAELQRRFNRPVKYLIYSHDHADHIAGGEVFADTATVIAHENAKAAIMAEAAAYGGAPDHLLGSADDRARRYAAGAFLCGPQSFR